MGLLTKGIGNTQFEIVPGFAVPRVFELETDEEEDLPCLVTLGIEFQDAIGKFVCTTATCKQRPGGPPVTGESIRAIPVTGLIHRSINNSGWIMDLEKLPGGGGAKMTPTDLPRDITGRGPTDEALRFVALAYRLAYALGEAPTKGVQERLKLPRSTAGRWVMKARERGYLGPATPGAAGERVGQAVETAQRIKPVRKKKPAGAKGGRSGKH